LGAQVLLDGRRGSIPHNAPSRSTAPRRTALGRARENTRLRITSVIMPGPTIVDDYDGRTRPASVKSGRPFQPRPAQRSGVEWTLPSPPSPPGRPARRARIPGFLQAAPWSHPRLFIFGQARSRGVAVGLDAW